MMSRRLWKTEKSSIVCRAESVSVTYSDTSRTVSGSELHSSGPDTEKLLLPYLVSLTRGTAMSLCVADRR